ncbi:hypothetical protein GPECTOR_2g1075 [Gonium pectorale]|uniref:Uncharacterized protein n=1 Tax=Gonium pectorale TaxID=33097 RepID=A0A150H033_GONPE|nr:hypothetical protein GPECTOR_2g1075 [Gonium pectorale]|eukprot:KXZ55526.1 hypothetical protein GPECTOR_2g1075 [Gonium pectorale]
MAVLKVVVSISIIVIVAVKLEDVRIEVQLPDLTTLDGLVNATSSLLTGGGDAAPGSSTGQALAPSPTPTPLPPGSSAVDLNDTLGPLHLDAACLLQKRGSAGQMAGDSHTMCTYVFGVCAISLLATLLMTSLLWCTCHLCGWGPVLELAFALLGTAWWLAAALVLQEHTDIAANARPAALRLIYGNASPPPPLARAMLSPPPSPPPPPYPPAGDDLAAQLGSLLHTWMPSNLRQWRQTVVGLSWTMMAMFVASAVLLLIEACGCLFDCCGCLCRCWCCPERPESRWRSALRRRKQLDGEEYIEMCGASTPSASVGGAPSPPGIVLVARSDVSSPASSIAGSPELKGRRGWWR